MLVGEDIWDLGLHLFFFVSGFDVAAPTDGSIGMDLGAGEMVDWNGAAPMVHPTTPLMLHG